MVTLQTLLYVLQVLVAIVLVGFILIQHGKGADAGAAFGSGASATVFGSGGSGNFMSKTTTVLAVLFLANSLALAYIARQLVTEDRSLMMQQETVTIPEGPIAVPGAGSDAPNIPGSTDTTESEIPAIPSE